MFCEYVTRDADIFLCRVYFKWLCQTIFQPYNNTQWIRNSASMLSHYTTNWYILCQRVLCVCVHSCQGINDVMYTHCIHLQPNGLGTDLKVKEHRSTSRPRWEQKNAIQQNNRNGKCKWVKQNIESVRKKINEKVTWINILRTWKTDRERGGNGRGLANVWKGAQPIGCNQTSQEKKSVK